VIEIRKEEERDMSAIRAVDMQAFARQAEADLVDALRAGDGVILSMVAVDEGEVVGHILFSPVTI
jgi:putative acetyltransferase